MNTQSKTKKRRRGLQPFRNPQSAFRIARDRRGILLLVVLSMLVLFLLVGTSFVVTSNQYRKANKTLGKPYAPAKSPLQHADLLEEVVNQLVRDTTNEFSSLRYHSLLRDLYGSDGLAFELPNAADGTGTTTITFAPNTGNQFIRIDMLFTTTPPLSTINGYYNGLVLTMADGVAGGQSARIVNYRYDPLSAPGVYRFEIMRFEDFTGLPDEGDRVVLNGRPFNGTGVGYNPGVAGGNPRLSTEESVVLTTGASAAPLALMPNAAFLFPKLVIPLSNDPNDYFLSQSEQLLLTQEEKEKLIAFRGLAGLGGADESYDAPDFQNMALAWSPVSPDETVMPSLEPPSSPDPLIFSREKLPPALGDIVLPSFHRPALINYWANLPSVSLQTEPSLLRKVMLRPNWFDHPEFTGSNPDVADLVAVFRTELLKDPISAETSNASGDLLLRMIYGPWDVDNDNDGRRDSVWVDFGAPVMMSPQGKLVKPLAAILCLDMDGRLNLNAHGSMADIIKPFFNLDVAGNPSYTDNNNVTFTESDALPHGQGYGPAEISLERVVGDFYRRILQGVQANEDRDLDAHDNEFDRAWSGRYGHKHTGLEGPTPGFLEAYDLLAQLKQQGLPQWADFGATLLERLGNYATPPDLKGRYSVGLNDLGQPVYEAARDSVNLDQDSPYELDLSRVGPNAAGDSAKDGPFSLAEMERILRAYDRDAGKLPARLWELANNFIPTGTSTVDIDELNEWRALLTTDSFDLPVPNVLLPDWMRLGPDGQPGVAGVDDDGNGFVDDVFEINFDGSDDFGEVMADANGKRVPTNLGISDLFEFRIRIELAKRLGGGMLPKNVPQATVQLVMNQLLAPELADGLRLDLNRPFGNGRDDDNNGVVDEPGEPEGAFWRIGYNRDDDDDNMIDERGEEEDAYGNAITHFLNANGRYRDNFDRNGNGVVGSSDPNDGFATAVERDNFRRQLFARHLYVLAMTLVDPLPPPVVSTPPTSSDKKRLRKHKVALENRTLRLAQWAINVVDFRDPDNIMTAFEFDANPFDGWGAVDNTGTFRYFDGDQRTIEVPDFSNDGKDNDGDLLIDKDDPDEIAERVIIWGAERPELVITETLGWHDRSTENHADEDPANDEDFDGDINDDDQGTVPQFASDSTKIPDSDYDQRLRPQGAAFVELYCPWPADTAANADTHRVNNSGADLGVNLSAFNTGPTGIRSPVWRLMMYKDGGPGMDPDNFSDETFRPKVPDRSVYFTGFDPAYPDIVSYPNLRNETRYVDDGVAFFNDATTNFVPSVEPGRYMVVGAGVDTNNDGRYLSAIGQTTSSLSGATRGIVLDTNVAATNAVALHRNATDIIDDQAGFQIFADSNTTSVAIIDQAMRPDPADPNPLRPTLPRQQKISRFTFSEPAGGYPDRIEGSRWNGLSYLPILDVPLDDQRQLFGQRKGLGGGGGGGTGLKPKRETTLNDGETRLMLPGFGEGGGGLGRGPRRGGQLGRSIEQASRTIPGFKWVYLQRLANPLLPWNPESQLPNGTPTPGYQSDLAVNPYLTIDSMGANVTVFTGLATEERRRKVPLEPRDPIATFSNRIPVDSFSSLQRGRINSPYTPSSTNGLLELQERLRTRSDGDVLARLLPTIAPALPANLWNPEAIGFTYNVITGSQEITGLWKNQAGANGDGTDSGKTSHNFNGIPDCTLGFLNEPFRDLSKPNPKLTPSQPFPWFTWNNRPFVNGNELMQVPAFRSSHLLQTFSFRTTGALAEENYDKDDQVVRLTERLSSDGPFGHLQNFFRTELVIDPRDPNGPGLGIAGLYRVLDYVGVPSRYVGTETWLNPAWFGDDGDITTTADNLVSTDDPRYQRQPPFNKISAYRDPGRVNLNTIADHRVWDGGFLHRELFDPDSPWNANLNNYRLDSGHLGPLFVEGDSISTFEPDFVAGRRGYSADSRLNRLKGAGTTDSLLLLDSNMPTFFANPFRSAGAGNLVPLVGMQRHDVDCTTLRRQMYSAGLDGLWGDPFVDDDMNGIVDDLSEAGMGTSNDDVILDSPLFSSDLAATAIDPNNHQYHDAARNAYFRYQPMTRLGSMATNHSNVYAVWITIGFFEVEEAPSLDDFATRNGFGTPNDARDLYARVYPEGYQLGREMGSDTGEFERLREFAIVDRSIPVAFEPGVDHNVERAVRLRRRIE